jgi:hypothetical protein
VIKLSNGAGKRRYRSEFKDSELCRLSVEREYGTSVLDRKSFGRRQHHVTYACPSEAAFDVKVSLRRVFEVSRVHCSQIATHDDLHRRNCDFLFLAMRDTSQDPTGTPIPVEKGFATLATLR